MTSEKQKKANVANAQLSTGPLTSEGKAVVARNAIKHGIFTHDLVINTGDGRENELEYGELLNELKQDLGPVGRMELMMVEKIAVNYWRLRRLVRHETGVIRKGLDDYRESALRSYYDNTYFKRQRPALEHFSYNDEITDTEYQAQLYKVATLRSSGFKLVEDRAALEYVLWFRMDREENEFSDEDYQAARLYVHNLSPQMRGKLRKEILDDAEWILAEMEAVRTWRVTFDRILKAKSLPSERDINNIIKYENSLERSIFRNLAALKALQNARK